MSTAPSWKDLLVAPIMCGAPAFYIPNFGAFA